MFKERIKQWKDRWVYMEYLAKIWGVLGLFGLKIGPRKFLRAWNEYPWIRYFLEMNKLYDVLVGGRRGAFREANAVLLSEIVIQNLDPLEALINRRDRLVLHEDLVPPEIPYAMGLDTWCLELLGFMIPMLSPEAAHNLLDEAENYGVPPDVCSLPRQMIGMALSKGVPAPAAILTSNSPCDGGMASYNIIENRLKTPIFRLDVPYRFDTERAFDYFVGELYSMIDWLERNTPGKMDWDRLREICQARNRYVETELDMWEMMRQKPAPMASEPVYLSHIWGYSVMPGRPGPQRMLDHLHQLARKALDNKESIPTQERYRTLLWGPFPAVFPKTWAWVEKTYGATMVIDSLTYHRVPVIDTSTKDSMMRGLARTIMAGPMARHSRGPYENYFDDLFHAAENFQVDMVWLAGHMGCKNAQALNGMLREKLRERGIPLLLMEFDLSDNRTLSEANLRGQIEHFMENVMQAKRMK